MMKRFEERGLDLEMKLKGFVEVKEEEVVKKW